MNRAANSELLKDVDTVAAFANHLMQTKPVFVQAVAAMLASRKLYAASTYEIDALLQKIDFAKDGPKQTDSPPLEWTDGHKVFLKEILITASVAKACDSFDSADLLKELIESVVPWLTRVSTEHTQAQSEHKRQAQEEAEKTRLQTKLDIGFPIQNEKIETEPSKLDRKLSVLFIGEKPAVRWLMQRVQSNLLEFGSGAGQLLHLACNRPVNSDPNSLVVDEKVWSNCTSTNDSFQQLYGSSIFPQLKNPIDAVLVDDISVAYQGLSFMPLLTRVNEAQHRLKKWTTLAGSLLISALPLDRKLKPNELHLADYEILRIHNLLRAVTTEQIDVEGVPHVKVIAGVEEVGIVPLTELQQFEDKAAT